MSNALLNVGVDESLRLELLAQEQKLRSKQPEAWTKTKFRKYANFGRNRKKEDEALALNTAATSKKPVKKAKIFR